MVEFSSEIDCHHHHQQFLSKFKENNENDIAAHTFWAVFYSSPTADFDGAAIPPPIFFMIKA